MRAPHSQIPKTPLALAWALLNAMPDYPRAEFLRIAVALGINWNTASTQYNRFRVQQARLGKKEVDVARPFA